MTARLMSRIVEAPGPLPTPCWVWQGGTNEKGYGRMRVGPRLERTHRIAYRLFRGPIPDGVEVMHACDNRPCCRPEHLSLGTTGDNARDRTVKGRGAGTKLDEDAVRDIRTRRLSQSAFAKLYRVARATIQAVQSGGSWKHLLPPEERTPALDRCRPFLLELLAGCVETPCGYSTGDLLIGADDFQNLQELLGERERDPGGNDPVHGLRAIVGVPARGETPEPDPAR